MSEKQELYERYGNETEAQNSVDKQMLLPRPNHEAQPKWIAEIGKVDPRRLGKRKNYNYRIEIDTKKDTRMWLRQFESKPKIEPNRYGITAERLPEFNSNYVILISAFKRGL